MEYLYCFVEAGICFALSSVIVSIGLLLYNIFERPEPKRLLEN